MGEVRQLVERFYNGFEVGDFAAARELFAEDCVNVSPAGSLSVDENLALAEAFKNALPNGYFQIDIVVESGDEAFIEGRLKGTHTGDLASPDGTIPASGNEIDLRFADYFKMEDGKFTEHHVFWDQMSMMGQLGALPPG